jgi:predicted esterase
MQRGALVAAVFFCVPTAHAAPGWAVLDLPSGGRATRYLPTGVSPDDPAPLVIFLHGAGGQPEHYHAHVDGQAEALDVVLLLPESAGTGWSGVDVGSIVEGLDAVEAELTIDDRRIYLAGHSAGGAFAYLLAYDGSEGFAAVFSMSAPFYGVAGVSDPMHTAPIRMYYGADDPNYTGGSATMLEAQWTQLGVPYETDVQEGHGHSTWPPSSIQAGFEFLLSVQYPGSDPEPEPEPEPGETSGETGDGGLDSETDSGTDSRGSVGTGELDDGGDDTGGDPSLPGAGNDHADRSSGSDGCGCSTERSLRWWGTSWLILLLPLARRGSSPRTARTRSIAAGNASRGCRRM